VLSNTVLLLLLAFLVGISTFLAVRYAQDSGETEGS